MSSPQSWQRLLWKQWRLIRPSGVVIFLVGAVLELVVYPLSDLQSLEPVQTTAVTLAILFAVTAAATSFSAEHEDRTFWFQRALPIRYADLVWTKIGSTIAGTLLLYLLLWACLLLGWRWSSPHWQSENNVLYSFVNGLFLMIEVAIYGTLFSLCETRPMVSLVKAIALALAVNVGGFFLDAIVFGFSRMPDFLWLSMVCRLTSAIAAIFLIAWMIPRWFADESRSVVHALSRNWRERSLPRLLGTASVKPGPWKRLFWLQQRIALLPILIAAAICLLCLLQDFLGLYWFHYPLIGTLLIGSFTFRGAIQNRNALSAIGASGTQLWFSQIAVPVVASGLVMADQVWAIWHMRQDLAYHAEFQSCQVAVLWSVAAFCWGQLASIRCRTLGLAIGMSLVATAIAAVWLFIVSRSGVAIWLFALPVFLYPLAESFVAARIFFRESRYEWRFWPLRVGLCVVLGLGLIVYRNLEFPDVSDAELAQAISIAPPGTQQQRLELRRLADRLTRRSEFMPSDLQNQAELFEAWRGHQRRWAEMHRREIEAVIDSPDVSLVAAAEDRAAFEADRARTARLAEFATAALELAIDDANVDGGERIIRRFPLAVGHLEILRWAKLPGNDPARLRALAQHLQSDALVRSVSARQLVESRVVPALIADWRKALAHASNGWDWVSAYFSEATIWDRRKRFFASDCVRKLSMLEPILSSQSSGRLIKEVFVDMRARTTSGRRLMEEVDAGTAAFREMEQTSARLIGMGLQLACVAWQRDHDGRLPASLSELLPEYARSIRPFSLWDEDFFLVPGQDEFFDVGTAPTGSDTFYYDMDGQRMALEVPFGISFNYKIPRDKRKMLPFLAIGANDKAALQNRPELPAPSAAISKGENFWISLPLDYPE
jgi:hypothetical protein